MKGTACENHGAHEKKGREDGDDDEVSGMRFELKLKLCSIAMSLLAST